MRTYEEIYETARDTPPFSNGTEWELWSANWCFAPCHNPVEMAWQRYEEGKRKTAPKDFPGGCPLIQCAMMGRTPTEWLEQPDDGYQRDYHCIEFRGPDGGGGGAGGGPPRPRREPKDMDGLFERPQRRVRMLKQPEPAPEPVPV
jgi:hypothetical protein